MPSNETERNPAELRIQREYLELQMNILKRVLKGKQQEYSLLKKKENQLRQYQKKEAKASVKIKEPKLNTRNKMVQSNEILSSPGTSKKTLNVIPKQNLVLQLSAVPQQSNIHGNVSLFNKTKNEKTEVKAFMDKMKGKPYKTIEPAPLLANDSAIARTVHAYENQNKPHKSISKSTYSKTTYAKKKTDRSTPSTVRKKNEDALKKPSPNLSFQNRTKQEGLKRTKPAPTFNDLKNKKVKNILNKYYSASDCSDTEKPPDKKPIVKHSKENLPKDWQYDPAIIHADLKKNIINEIHKMKEENQGSRHTIDANDIKIRAIAQLCLQRKKQSKFKKKAVVIL